MSHKTIIRVDGESRQLITYSTNYFRTKPKMKNLPSMQTDSSRLFEPIAADLRAGCSYDDRYYYSQPYPQAFGGLFYISLEATDNDDLFYYWLKSGEMMNGSIEFYNTLDEDDIPFQRIEFWDAFLVSIKEQTTQGAFPMIMECDISAAIVRHNRNNATLYRKSWYVTDIDEKPISWNNEAEEEDIERLLIRQVEGGKEAQPGEVIKYKVTQYNQDTATDNDKQSIRWAVRLGDGNEISLPESEYKGEEIELEIKNEWAGKEILVMPYLIKPWDRVAQKTMVIKYQLPILIAESKKKAGRNPGNTDVSDDMKYNDFTADEVIAIHPLFRADVNLPARSLFNAMERMATSLFSTGELEVVVKDMIQNFKHHSRSTYTNPVLNKHVRKHQATNKFIEDVKKALSAALHKSKGDPNYFLRESPIDKITEPNFSRNADIINGLTITIHDVWAYKVWLTGYQYIHPNRYKASIHVEFYDHFGLDRPDVEKKYVYLAGFRSWFVLQHIRGYKPFTTLMEFDYEFEETSYDV